MRHQIGHGLATPRDRDALARLGAHREAGERILAMWIGTSAGSVMAIMTM